MDFVRPYLDDLILSSSSLEVLRDILKPEWSTYELEDPFVPGKRRLLAVQLKNDNLIETWIKVDHRPDDAPWTIVKNISRFGERVRGIQVLDIYQTWINLIVCVQIDLGLGVGTESRKLRIYR